ncbi:hypothetical protein ACE1AT_04730 [Pelatocladus sp. BLCC-F211]|uniref:hypothetical protein n=1 Tax=Pelatocladus sp. BLCC-F211 TaxID=3342752 RepID=UPI0035BA5715
MTQTSDALVLQAEVITRLAQLIIDLINSKNASDIDKEAALAQVQELLTADTNSAATVDELTSKLQELVDTAAAALPGSTSAPEESQSESNA